MNKPLQVMSSEAKAVLDEYMGDYSTPIHIWEVQDAPDYIEYNVVTIFATPSGNKTISFLRLFPIAGQYQISCDRTHIL
jgi:hypothetical protein